MLLGRSVIGALACVLLVSTNFAACPEPKDLDVSLMLMNFKSPLVSAQLAELIAWDFFQVRYSGGGVLRPGSPQRLLT